MIQEDYDSGLMDDMDPHLRDFLKNRVNSFIKWDLVRFFHDNPHAADTAENIARYISRDGRTIEDELLSLASAGVLLQRELSGTKVYSLATDPEMRSLLSQFVVACNDREFRVKAIHYVIRGMQ
jgi:hypothetical protein